MLYEATRIWCGGMPELFCALQVTDAELVVAFVALAAGELTEEELTIWFREHLAQ